MPMKDRHAIDFRMPAGNVLNILGGQDVKAAGEHRLALPGAELKRQEVGQRRPGRERRVGDEVFAGLQGSTLFQTGSAITDGVAWIAAMTAAAIDSAEGPDPPTAVVV